MWTTRYDRHPASDFTHGHPMLEVTIGLAMNLVIVMLFAAYPARWFGLW
jgi:hypothetical protein